MTMSLPGYVFALFLIPGDDDHDDYARPHDCKTLLGTYIEFYILINMNHKQNKKRKR